ncbi:MAG: hypothetical protein KGN34_12285 [Sphingomonadales bacterium]|nr:hypothetical protein [Sphingomonadales bacterium]
MINGLLAGLLLVMLFAHHAPDTPIARAWQDVVVGPLARRLGAITRGQALLAGSIVVVALFVVWALQAEGAQVFAMALPDVLAWASVFEVSSLLDALVATVIVASGVRMRPIRMVVARLRPRRRRARRVASAARLADNDDDASLFRLAQNLHPLGPAGQVPLAA